MDINRYPLHGQMIGWEARPQHRAYDRLSAHLVDPIWRKYWALYRHLRLAIESDQRVFESNYVSLIM